MERIGLVGLGLMGGALAERFRSACVSVVAFDPREEARKRLMEIGGEPVSTVGEVFGRERTVLLSLPNSDVVASVIREAGASLIGATIIDTTTGDPSSTEEFSRELAARGANYLDATITGSSAEARRGEVIVTAGGGAEAFAACEPVFRLFARRWFHVGPCGSGARVKLAINLVLGLNRAVLAEGLSFARSCGMDPETLLQILRESAAYSRVMDTKGRKMVESDFAPEARLAQHFKDVRLLLAAGKRAGANLPFSQLHESLLDALAQRGLGDCDNSAIIRAFDIRAFDADGGGT